MNLNELAAIDKNICLGKLLIVYNWTDEDTSASNMRRIHRAASPKSLLFLLLKYESSLFF